MKKILNLDMSIYRFEEVGSTNEKAKQLLEKENEEFLVLAEKQTQGRGRKDRTWESPKGGIYMTIAKKVQEKPQLLQLKASVAVAKALKQYGLDPDLKWPNDVYLDGGKVCGILSELVDGWAVVGIGLNYEVAPLEDSVCVADFVFENVGKEELVESVVKYFEGVENVLDIYEELCITIGEKIRAETTDGIIKGEVTGVGKKGRLVLENGEKITSGDVNTIF